MAKAPGKTTSSGSSEGLTFDTVVELLTMLDGSDLPTRIVYKDGPLRLEVERGTSSAPVVVAAPPVAPAVAVAPTPAPQDAVAAPAATPAPATEGRGEPVAAPIAGVFYRAPSPDAPPFVEVGQQVGADDVIGIVEVMKLMNTVRAGVAGTVVEVCVDNAELVEFEQVLVRIEA
ncbi:acetyl-CoA carboxylase biotin carboxyl carrier protein [Nocardioides carbamazepini]|uniref:acetyl-CoA carboxylase biotin carboxyl carrier protein n=1 Tax=Nocardioides carbamazepini TaxID=2854259 RepID=UPI002149BC32|nr:acetyl-CoA carboxylase biotin carboxyl carrier protein [Nocardioides carbamazepini]MCR1782448.1 acetyl-CoA carboxylase biotin carboxyl carrier protein [Nocardioides carbamazepini]